MKTKSNSTHLYHYLDVLEPVVSLRSKRVGGVI